MGANQVDTNTAVAGGQHDTPTCLPLIARACLLKGRTDDAQVDLDGAVASPECRVDLSIPARLAPGPAFVIRRVRVVHFRDRTEGPAHILRVRLLD